MSKPPAGSLPESQTTGPVKKAVNELAQHIVNTKARLVALESKPWGPIRADGTRPTQGQQLADEHAKATSKLAEAKAKLAELKAQLDDR